jgi:hypothetical protein
MLMIGTNKAVFLAQLKVASGIEITEMSSSALAFKR